MPALRTKDYAINIDDRNFKRYMKKIGVNLPLELDRTVKNFTTSLATAIKKSAIRQKLYWGRSRSLTKSIQSVRLKKSSYGVKMNTYGLYLDGDWIGHRNRWTVSLRNGGSKLREWAKYAERNAGLVKSGKSRVKSTIIRSGKSRFRASRGTGFIVVTRRPFIRAPVMQQFSMLDRNLRAAAERGTR